MAASCIRVTVIVLCFSYLVRMNLAIPVTRASNPVQKPYQIYEVNGRDILENFDEKSRMVDQIANRRMEIELNDYPGSEANNRHTPRAQLGRGCIDC